jgi:hypothetical protein
MEIEPDEVSAVDMPAIGEPHFVLKGMNIKKANEPKEGMSQEELEAAREARSKAFGIEVLEKGSHLTYPSGFPTSLDQYGDPVNLKYPTDTKERAANARVRFKQNHGAYKKDSSKKVVHERIVRAELKHGIEPGYDPDDPLDQMLPSDLKDQLAKSDSVEKQGGQMPSPVKKLDESHVPRPVMKAVDSRLKRAVESVGELQAVAKSLTVAEDGDARNAPPALVTMTKAVAAEIRSLLPDADVPVYKRGRAEAVMSLHQITKRAEEIAKAGAVSYLIRDQYVSVTQNVSEYLTTYVDGIEHDADGPMLIPEGLESTVDKTAGALEELAEEYPAGDDAPADEPENIEEPQVAGTIAKVGVDFAGEFAKLNKSIMAIPEMVAKVVASSQEETDMSQEIEDTEVVDDDQQTTDEDTEDTEEETSEDATVDTDDENADEPEDAPAEEPVAKTGDPVLKALAAMEGRMNKRFDKIEGEVEEVRGVAKAADEKVEKAMKRRADSKGGGNDSTTKVKTEKKDGDDPASFKGVLNLPGL